MKPNQCSNRSQRFARDKELAVPRETNNWKSKEKICEITVEQLDPFRFHLKPVDQGAHYIFQRLCEIVRCGYFLPTIQQS